MKKINIKFIDFKSLVLIFYICLFCISCSSRSEENLNHVNKFILHGKVLNQKDGFLMLEYTPDSIMVKDTVFIKNGEFTYEGSIPEPTLAHIMNDNERGTFYIEQKTMTITLIKDKFDQLKLKGSKTQNESEQLEIIRNNSRSIGKVLHSEKDSLKKLKTKIEKIELEKKLKEVDRKIAQEDKSLQSNIIKFILSNPKSFIVPFQLIRIQESYSISLDSIKSIFKGLDISIQNSKDGQILRNIILKEERIQIGAIPPDFNAVDINNDQVTLRQFKGQNVVLLEFWASWCIPCRKSFPHLKELHKKYQSYGFEILAISVFDKNIESWKEAINQENINGWYNIASTFMDGEVMNKVFFEEYKPLPIPKKILIDKTGRVVGLWTGYSEEIENDIDNKLKEIFSKQDTIGDKNL